jgi:hypothetical protein
MAPQEDVRHEPVRTDDGPPGAAWWDGRRHDTIREGVVAGAIGATAVALWFLVVDALAGAPLYTPSVLGDAVTAVLWPEQNPSPIQNILLYTIVHYLAFALIGIVTVAIVHGSQRQPAMLAGLLMLFVAFEVAIYGFTYLLSLWAPLQDIAWYQIGIANLLAAFLMGRWLWRRHPELTSRLNEVLSGL